MRWLWLLLWLSLGLGIPGVVRAGVEAMFGVEDQPDGFPPCRRACAGRMSGPTPPTVDVRPAFFSRRVR
jgi:hypothetical protein